MFNSFNNAMETFKSVLIVILVALIVGVIIYWAIKYPKFRKGLFITLGVIGCLLTIGAGCYSTYMLNTYYSAKGGIIGKLQEFVNPNQVQVVDDLTFDFKTIEMRTVEPNGDIYRANVSITGELRQPENSKFVLLVNNTPCNFAKDDASTEYLIANYVYTFYGDNKEELLTDTLTIRVLYLGTTTKVTVETKGGANAAKYWNTYFNRNGFKITLTTDSYFESGIEFGEGDTSNYVVVKFVNLDEESFQVVSKGSKLNPPTIDNDRFLGWSYNGTIIDENFVVHDEIELIANYDAILGKITSGVSFAYTYEGQTYSKVKDKYTTLVVNFEPRKTDFIIVNNSQIVVDTNGTYTTTSIGNGEYKISWENASYINIDIARGDVSYT